MDIYISSGKGEGHTTLSAFDAALGDTGVMNYNLIPLSSIIPPKSRIIRKRKIKTKDTEFGHRLYVVLAEMRTDKIGKSIAAGIGWYQLEDGRGFFVEHHEISETRTAVESEINAKIEKTLRDMCVNRGIVFKRENVNKEICISEVKNNPTCVLAIAVFKAEPWM